MMQDLIFVGDKVPPLFAIAGDGGAGYGQFYPESKFEGCINKINSVQAHLTIKTSKPMLPKTGLDSHSTVVVFKVIIP